MDMDLARKATKRHRVSMAATTDQTTGLIVCAEGRCTQISYWGPEPELATMTLLHQVVLVAVARHLQKHTDRRQY